MLVEPGGYKEEEEEDEVLRWFTMVIVGARERSSESGVGRGEEDLRRLRHVKIGEEEEVRSSPSFQNSGTVLLLAIVV